MVTMMFPQARKMSASRVNSSAHDVDISLFHQS